jgi:hypothetical protein
MFFLGKTNFVICTHIVDLLHFSFFFQVQRGYVEHTLLDSITQNGQEMMKIFKCSIMQVYYLVMVLVTLSHQISH